MPKKKQEKFSKGEILIYKPLKGEVELKVRLEGESVWLDAHQMATIFDVNRPAVVKHINNIYKTKELEEKSTCSILEQVAADGKIRKMNLYNLDMIISVGYRINSRRATQFRIWATNILRKYLVSGYVVNKNVIADNYDKFLETVEDIKKLLPSDKNINNESILELVKTFADTWLSLDAYDRDKLDIEKITKRKVKLAACELEKVIADFKKELIKKKEATDIFAQERQRGALGGIVGSVMQSFNGKDLYLGLEEKAAHLLYFIVKNHPFVDGNKRSGAYAFVWFLRRTKLLNIRNLTPAALTAITLLIAESRPKDKDKMVALVTRMIKK